MFFLTGAGGSAATGYTISRSLRFNDDDIAFLSRTPASAGNRRTWTWSGWVKRGNLAPSTQMTLFSCHTANNDNDALDFDFTNDTLRVVGWTTTFRQTTAVYRDSSAWYHIVLSVDTTSATANNRLRLYVNGTEVTSFTSLNNPSLNADLAINQASAHAIGREDSGSTDYFDGYMTEIHFVDGTALTPSSFGETDATTGVWKPKRVTGVTYGTNGFWLSFANNTSTTTLGQDDAGGAAGSGAGSNDWTLNNFSVTAGAGNDSLVDTPTNNYCTLNAIALQGNTLSNGNLQATLAASSASTLGVKGTIGISSGGKFYWEVTPTSAIGVHANIGIVRADTNSAVSTAGNFQVTYRQGGGKFVNGAATAYGASYAQNDVIGVALDYSANEVTFYKNGSSQGAIALPDTSVTYVPVVENENNIADTYVANFGQRPFAYTPPTGFSALCTSNLPTPTIRKPSQHFNAVTYTGTGSSLAVTGVGHQPDLAWIKSRSAATDHALYDAVRGLQARLESNQTDAEATSDNGLTAFGTDGFTVNTLAQVNTNTATYVGWCWKEGVTPGFDIVSYTGNGSNRTIAHNLGAAPHFMIVKRRSTSAGSWRVYHRNANANPQNGCMFLEGTQAFTTTTVFNNTSPTSSVFSVGTDPDINANNETYIAYLFTEISGFSRFGSYTGNGSTDGPFVWCGFRPRWLMFKRIDSTGGWYIFDSARETANVMTLEFAANASHAENTYGTLVTIDMLSNGFKCRNTDAEFNASGGTYIFAAFAESPFKYALAR